MSPFEQVYLEVFNFFVEKSGSNEVVTSGSLANKFGISGAYLSRIRNGRSGVSDQVINKITEVLKEIDDSFAAKIRADLERAQEDTRKTKTKKTIPSVAENDASDEYALKPLEDFFALLGSAEHSLLCIDFRDSPQRAAIPHLAELIGSAVKSGLSLAMFQPFGPKLKLLERGAHYISRIQEVATAKTHHRNTAQAYFDLYKLADAVEEVAKEIKESSENFDRVVLYEAERDDPDLPLNAIGIQSRLFYARYQINKQWNTRVYDWVTGQRRAEHFFIERSSMDISFDVIKSQFHPIPKFWQENDFRLPQAQDLTSYVRQDWKVRWVATES